jgi:thiol:disulfide interchange protein DsbC
MRKHLFLLSLFFLPLSTNAEINSVKSQKILDKLLDVRPDFAFSVVSETEIDGMYSVDVQNGPTLYISEDGKYFFVGDYYEVGEKGLINLGELAKASKRVEALSNLNNEDMIIFGPENPKTYVYVFTDVDCYYCQKLHLEVPDLTELGIEVRYLAYPRAGVGSLVYQKMASAWCSDNPNKSLTDLKAGKDIDINLCEANPVMSQYSLGNQAGVKGTPAIITSDGKLLPGYMPAEKLAEQLGL